MKYGQMELTIEMVTPEMANEWLETKNHCNRRMRRLTAEQYARDMTRGDWQQKPLAICFDPDGNLGNGQHTLWAIRNSKIAQELLIARNVPAKSIAIMDSGLKRTLSDVAKFVDSGLNSQRGAIVRIIENGTRNVPMTFYESVEAYERWKDQIEFVLSVKGTSKMHSAALGVSALALCSAPRSEVRRFLECLVDGTCDTGEEAAIRLRDVLNGGQKKDRAVIYQKTTAALDFFIQKRTVAKLLPRVEDTFRVRAGLGRAGNDLRVWREKNGLLQREAADMVQIHPTAWGRYEGNGDVPILDIGKRIAQLIGKPLRELWPSL